MNVLHCPRAQWYGLSNVDTAFLNGPIFNRIIIYRCLHCNNNINSFGEYPMVMIRLLCFYEASSYAGTHTYACNVNHSFVVQSLFQIRCMHAYMRFRLYSSITLIYRSVFFFVFGVKKLVIDAVKTKDASIFEKFGFKIKSNVE